MLRGTDPDTGDIILGKEVSQMFLGLQSHIKWQPACQ